MFGRPLSVVLKVSSRGMAVQQRFRSVNSTGELLQLATYRSLADKAQTLMSDR